MEENMSRNAALMSRIRMVLSVGILAPSLVGCGAMYAMRVQLAAPVAKEQGMAVVVYDETATEGGGLLPGGGGPTAEHPLAAIFSASLMEKGVPVKSIDLDQLVPEGIQEHVVTPASYTVSQNRSKDAAAPQGGAGLIMDESLSKLNDVSALVNGIPASWGIGYLLVLYKLGPYSYVAHVFRLTDKAIVFTFMFDGNDDGWNQQFQAPAAWPNGQDYSVDPKSEWYRYMQLAEKVCAMF
jgi:hypothetical protein